MTSMILSYCTIFGLVFFLVFQLLFLIRKRSVLTQKSFKKRFDSLYKDLDVERDGSIHRILFTTLFCLRRILMVVVVVKLTDAISL